MKKVLIGGFLALIGSIWMLTLCVLAATNLVSGWSTPPGRFLTTIGALGLSLPFAVAIILLGLGLLILSIEYFRKEK